MMFALRIKKRKNSNMAKRFKTGVECEYIEQEVLPLFDAHMHIQSNNCCPLPVQLGVLAGQLFGIFGRDVTKDRKDLLDTMCAWYTSLFTGRFGKVGRLSSDLVGKLYMGELKNEDLRFEHVWTMYDDEEIKKLNDKEGLDTNEKIRLRAVEDAKLDAMTVASNTAWKNNFVEATSYYFRNTQFARMNLALCMDLSYTHYWGRLGLPVYLEADNNMFFINDFMAVNLKRKGLYRDTVYVTLNEGVVDPETDIDVDDNGALDINDDRGSLIREKAKIHLHSQMSVRDVFGISDESFYAWQYRISNPDISLGDKDVPLIKYSDRNPETEKLTGKEFTHFLTRAQGDEEKWFEDYAMQRELTIATMVNYPLSLFGAYHYDPRRHLVGEPGYDIESMAERIVGNHAFYNAGFDGLEKRTLQNDVEYEGTVTVASHVKLNDKAYIKNILSEHQRTTEEALDDVFTYSQNGPFWAIKLYPRLGWSPDDFTNFPNLEKLYKLCSDNVPLMVHCSLGGMSAHDYYLYERYDDNIPKGKYKLKDAEKRFDGAVPDAASHDSPVQWRNVLSNSNYSKLKVCLAHFGGYNTWKDVGDFEKAEEKLAERHNASNPKKYDKYDIYRDWIRTIAELVQNHDNVYTDVSYFKNTGYFRRSYSRDHFDREDEPEYNLRVANNLVYLLKKYPDLKHRVLVGTDWLMIEIEKESGIGEYMGRMFETLKEVSKKVDYDAWHQFAVINPLRYFGLIDEEKGNEGPFTIDTGKLGGYGEILKQQRRGDSPKDAAITISSEELNDIINELVINLTETKIYSSKDIKINNHLLILKK
jgi:hypothetical protein